MKKTIFLLAALGMMVACQQPEIITEDDGTGTNEPAKTKKFTFTVKGAFAEPEFNIDFTYREPTRAYLAADGQNMTDLWVFDFVGDECVQTLHQSGSDADFGTPSLQLTYGPHHVYFVASRGTAPVADATANTITWTRPSDTFWADYPVTVVSTSNGNRAVTLDRVATKLKVTATDEVPADVATLELTPSLWYYGINYVTGEPAAAVNNQPRTVTVPSSYIGTTGQLTMSIFGFSASEQWTTDVMLSAKDAQGTVIGQAQIVSAPFVRNRATEYSGPLFGASGLATVSLNADWVASYSGEW
jgi:hypothetical protein